MATEDSLPAVAGRVSMGGRALLLCWELCTCTFVYTCSLG